LAQVVSVDENNLTVTEFAYDGAEVVVITGQTLFVKLPEGLWTQVPEGRVAPTQDRQFASVQTPPVNVPLGLH